MNNKLFKTICSEVVSDLNHPNVDWNNDINIVLLNNINKTSYVKLAWDDDYTNDLSKHPLYCAIVNSDFRIDCLNRYPGLLLYQDDLSIIDIDLHHPDSIDSIKRFLKDNYESLLR